MILFRILFIFMEQFYRSMIIKIHIFPFQCQLSNRQLLQKWNAAAASAWRTCLRPNCSNTTLATVSCVNPVWTGQSNTVSKRVSHVFKFVSYPFTRMCVLSGSGSSSGRIIKCPGCRWVWLLKHYHFSKKMTTVVSVYLQARRCRRHGVCYPWHDWDY